MIEKKKQEEKDSFNTQEECANHDTSAVYIKNPEIRSINRFNCKTV